MLDRKFCFLFLCWTWGPLGDDYCSSVVLFLSTCREGMFVRTYKSQTQKTPDFRMYQERENNLF